MLTPGRNETMETRAAEDRGCSQLLRRKGSPSTVWDLANLSESIESRWYAKGHQHVSCSRTNTGTEVAGSLTAWIVETDIPVFRTGDGG